ncbi:hypothetical protein Tco_0822388 [Tanacetum coccineum]|uniref:Uncharacterized protein n=1 Tax=Tanacetum coccineum TaxID=301880 RepID=A0ABQ5AGQ8_9ASTR
MVVKGEILNDFLRFISILIAEFAAGDAVNLALKMKGDMMMKGGMIIKNLDLKPMIDAMMREFLDQMRLPNIVPYGELNGVPVALVARFGVLSKSADKILVSHGGRRE